MKIFMFTHQDLDGAGCAVLVDMAFKADIGIEFCGYDNVDDKLMAFSKSPGKMAPDDLFLITDICPSKDTCKALDKENKGNLKLIDHHKTKKWVSKYPWATFDERACATLLVHRWLISIGKLDAGDESLTPEKMLCFAKAIDAWDRWLLDSDDRPRGESLNDLSHFIGLEEFLKVFNGDPEADLDDPLKFIVYYLNKRKERIIARIIRKQLHDAPYRMDNFGNTYKILFAEDYISEVGHAALEDEDSQDLQYVVIASPVSNRCGMRSRGDVDVSKIAELLTPRGGGHAAASGFIHDFRQKIENIIFTKLDKVDKPTKP
jgi:oligoribonuclease NrnB/cAMP/cGMP phosphodiesterase (DHH superfamily)